MAGGGYLAAQLGVDDASVAKPCVERTKTPYGHAWEIAAAFGYRQILRSLGRLLTRTSGAGH